MSNDKQSSVEWLVEILGKYNEEMVFLYQNEIEQAKAMHKEEITDAYHDGKTNGMDISHPLSLTKEISANEWYNETFGE